jgi:hypothetical protein
MALGRHDLVETPEAWPVEDMNKRKSVVQPSNLSRTSSATVLASSIRRLAGLWCWEWIPSRGRL